MILWRDGEEKKKAAAAFKPDAFHCLRARRDRRDRPRAARAARRTTPTRPRAALQASARRRARELDGTPGRRSCGPRAAREVPGAWASSPDLRRWPSRFLHTIHRVFNGLSTRSDAEATIGGLRRLPPSGGACSTFSPLRGQSHRAAGPSRHNGEDASLDTTGANATPRRRRSRSAATAAGGADLRRPAPRRTPPPLRLPARARRRARARGPCRRAFRSSRATRRSPCTSRTTRSSTRPSRARSRRASTAAGRSRSGTTAPTSCSRRSATAS